MEAASAGTSPPERPSGDSGRGRIIALSGLLGKTGTRRRRWLLAAVLLVAAVTWHASLRQPIGPASGDSVQETSTAAVRSGEAFRFGTWNIHGCVGTDGRYDEARVAQALTGLDVVGLNEVHGWSFAASSSQVAALGQRLRMGWLDAPAERRWYCQQFGNGLLTTLPLDRWQRIPLPGKFAKSRRNLVLAQIRPGERRVQVLLAHLIRKDEALRQQQFREAATLFLSLEEPAVMAGDLNADGSDPQIQELLTKPGVADALASQRPSREAQGIDWIFVRGLQAREAGIQPGDASDHPLLWAELVLPGKNEEQ
jgi:endonuclease/exonuclease/phosphatase family metal-dependent hydrolase